MSTEVRSRRRRRGDNNKWTVEETEVETTKTTTEVVKIRELQADGFDVNHQQSVNFQLVYPARASECDNKAGLCDKVKTRFLVAPRAELPMLPDAVTIFNRGLVPQ
ncbi:hypothetical protein BaRGS_00006786 [Batillaria attramentaria]|uniref:Uncharacterized protein n=1 Tax=Batillaria attramentaria TaxID=370345 RepID=A0ABD0LR43_9CAEN